MKKLIWLGLPIVALTGCAGTTYVHESRYDDDYYYPRYPAQEVYIHRETYYEPRPRVIVVDQPRTVIVRPPEPPHRHLDGRRIEERHQHRHEERRDDRQDDRRDAHRDDRRDLRRDGPRPGDRMVSQPRPEGDQRVGLDPRRGEQAPVSTDKPRRDQRQTREEERDQQRPR